MKKHNFFLRKYKLDDGNHTFFLEEMKDGEKKVT